MQTDIIVSDGNNDGTKENNDHNAMHLIFRHVGGGKSFNDNNGGIAGTLRGQLLTDFSCLLGILPKCVKPDIFVFQSCYSDLTQWESALRLVSTLMQRIRKQKGSRVFWKGNPELGSQSNIIEFLNLVARFESRIQGVRYIDTQAASQYFQNYMNISQFISHGIETHMGTLRHYNTSDLTLSSWMTQFLLNEIC